MPTKKSSLEKLAARWPGDTDYKVNPSFWKTLVIIDGIKYRRHINGGGLVATTAQVAINAFVGVDARVSGNAQVSGTVWVSGTARVFDKVIS